MIYEDNKPYFSTISYGSNSTLVNNATANEIIEAINNSSNDEVPNLGKLLKIRKDYLLVNQLIIYGEKDSCSLNSTLDAINYSRREDSENGNKDTLLSEFPDMPFIVPDFEDLNTRFEMLVAVLFEETGKLWYIVNKEKKPKLEDIKLQQLNSEIEYLLNLVDSKLYKNTYEELVDLNLEILNNKHKIETIMYLLTNTKTGKHDDFILIENGVLQFNAEDYKNKVIIPWLSSSITGKLALSIKDAMVSLYLPRLEYLF